MALHLLFHVIKGMIREVELMAEEIASFGNITEARPIGDETFTLLLNNSEIVT